MSNRLYGVTPVALLVLVLFGTTPPAAFGQEHGTPEEARALVERAVALYGELGREAAFDALEDPEGDFVDRDLYVFVFGPERQIVAHGGDPELVGTPAAGLVDVDGVRFGDRFMDEANEEGVWIEYQWVDPVSGEVHPKRSWVVLHDGYVFGAGVYER